MMTPSIASLPARLAIKRRLVDDDDAFFALLELLDRLAALDERDHLALGGLGLVAQKLGCPRLVEEIEPKLIGRRLARSGPSLARLGLLLGHGRVELVDVDADIPRLQRVLRKVQRKAVGVVKLESHIARQGVAGLRACRKLRRAGQAARERFAEADFLDFERLADQRLAADKLGVGLPHLAHENGQQAVEQRLLGAEDDAHAAWRAA